MFFRLWYWLRGWVRVKTEGGFPEAFMNDALYSGIVFRYVQRQGERMSFYCPAGQYPLLRSFARKRFVRMRMADKGGLPFALLLLRRRKGLILAFCLYIAVLGVLFPRIWVIRVNGNTQTPTQDILAVVEKVGVKIGEKADAVDRKKLEIEGGNALPTVAFISVNLSGCVANVEIKEREMPPPILDDSGCSDLVAQRDGEILSVTVFGGCKTVLPGEAVTAGTVLAKGRVTTEEGERFYRCYGEVIAKTNRLITVKIPLQYQAKRLTKKRKAFPVLTVLSLKIPLSGGVTHTDPTAVHRQTAHFLVSKDKTLPFGLATDYYYETVTETRNRTEAQAQYLAEKHAENQAKALFSTIPHTEISRSTTTENGCYVLRVTYECEENIAVEVPCT